MVMLRPPGKAAKVATKVLKNKGVKVPAAKQLEKIKLQGPYLQH